MSTLKLNRGSALRSIYDGAALSLTYIHSMSLLHGAILVGEISEARRSNFKIDHDQGWRKIGFHYAVEVRSCVN